MKTAWKGFGLYSSAVDSNGNTYSDQYDVFSYGAGYLDVWAALNNSDTSAGSATSPTAVYDAASNNVYVVNTVGGSSDPSCAYSVANTAARVAPFGQYPVWNQVLVSTGGAVRSAPAAG